MDVFGERIFRNNAQRRKHEEQIKKMQLYDGSKVPPAVKSAYIPTGQFEFDTIPRLFIAGTGGTLFGSLISLIVILLSVGVFIIFDKIGSCLDIFYFFAALGYFLGPSCIGVIAASVIGGRGAKWAKCRSAFLAAAMALFWGIVALLAIIFVIEDILVKHSFSFWLLVDNGMFNSMPQSMKGGIARTIIFVVTGLINIIFPPIIAYRLVMGQRFCEYCHEYLNSSIIKKLPGNKIKELLLAILEGNKELFSKLSYIQSFDGMSAWLDIKHYSCSCKRTNFIDIIYNWLQEVKGRTEKNERIIYSGEFTDDQINILNKMLAEKKERG